MNSYDKWKVEKRRKKLMVEMEGHLFNVADRISIVDFLNSSKSASNNLMENKGATIFILLHFITGNAKKDLMQSFEEESTRSLILRFYDETHNYLLQTYADNGKIFATEAAI